MAKYYSTGVELGLDEKEYAKFMRLKELFFGLKSTSIVKLALGLLYEKHFGKEEPPALDKDKNKKNVSKDIAIPEDDKYLKKKKKDMQKEVAALGEWEEDEEDENKEQEYSERGEIW